MKRTSFQAVTWLLLIVITGGPTPSPAVDVSNEYDKPISRSVRPRDPGPAQSGIGAGARVERPASAATSQVAEPGVDTLKAGLSRLEEVNAELTRALRETGEEYERLKSEYDRLAEWSRDERSVRSGKSLREQLDGVNNIALVSSLNDVALLMVSEGRLDTAEEMYRRALVMLDHINGRTGVASGTILQGLADVAWRKNDLLGAESFYREAGAIFAKSLGKSSPRYAAALNGWASVLRAGGKAGEAEALFREALDVYGQRAYRKRPDAAIVRHNLGLLLMEQGRLDEAELLLEDSVEQLQAEPGAEARAMIALRTLARCHRLAGNPEKASACEERVDQMAVELIDQ